MRLINPNFELLKDAPATQKAWERVIRKHVDNEEMYFSDSLIFERVKKEHEGLISELIQGAMIGDI